MIKGVIFDLDGVLVSTDEMHYRAWKALAEKLGIEGFTRKDNERQRGVSRMASLEVVLEKTDRQYTDEEKTALAEEKNDIYVELLQDMNENAPLPGAKDTLLYLHDRGIRTAVGSASKNTPLILEKTGLAPLLDEVASGLDVTRSKPDPEVFMVAAAKMGLRYEECLVVEDAAAGIEAASRAGMPSLGVGPLHASLGATYNAAGLDTFKDWDTALRA